MSDSVSSAHSSLSDSNSGFESNPDINHAKESDDNDPDPDQSNDVNSIEDNDSDDTNSNHDEPDEDDSIPENTIGPDEAKDPDHTDDEPDNIIYGDPNTDPNTVNNNLTCLENTPLQAADDWKHVVVARMALWGEGGVQASLMQSKDGAESGSAHGSVRDRQAVKQSVMNRWVMVEQPLGYVTRMSGYHSVYGKDCLLHSVRFEFESGQIIEFEGTRDDWKGEAFLVENLPDNFFVSALEFEGGVCTGYRGYSTPQPLHDMMEDESEPDMEVLLMQDISASSSNVDLNPYMHKRQNNKDDNKEEDEIENQQLDLNGWRPESLKAKELEHPGLRESIMLAYVCLLGRDALQGAIFYFYDGHREGKLSAVRKRGIGCCKGFKLETDINCDVEQFDMRGATFIPVEQPGGRINTITGRNLAPILPSTTTEKGPKVTYLCHTLNIQFASGQIIKFVGSNDDWKGQYFSYTMPSDFHATGLEFAPARIGSPGPSGILVGVNGVRTYDDAEDLDLPPIENTENPSWDTCACCLP